MSAFTQSPTTFIWRWLFVTCIWKQNDFQRIHTHCTSAKICCPMTVNSNWKLAKTEMKTLQTFGSCSTPLFNQSNQLPRVLQGFQSNWVVRNWPGRVSILRKLESRGTVWWIALWWHSAVPVSGLDANVHASIQLQKEKTVQNGGKISHQGHPSALVVKEPQNASTFQSFAPCRFCNNDWKDLGLGDDLFLTWPHPKLHELTWYVISHKEALLLPRVHKHSAMGDRLQRVFYCTIGE